MDLRKLIREYLSEAKLMQLATIDENGSPWICSVWFASDEDLNIYWFSSLTREHSKHLKSNDKVAAAMALPQTPQDKPRGLQLSGRAMQLVEDKDIEKAKSLYVDRIFDEKTVDDFIANEAKPHRFYMIKPDKIVLFDTVNYPEESRQELNL